jgi:hypothetical protein
LLVILTSHCPNTYFYIDISEFVVQNFIPPNIFPSHLSMWSQSSSLLHTEYILRSLFLVTPFSHQIHIFNHPILPLPSSSSLAKQPFWAIMFPRRFCQMCLPLFNSLDFATIHFFTEQGRQPCVQPPTRRTMSLCISVPQRHGGPALSPDTGFPFRRLVRLAGLRWRYSNPSPHENSSASPRA